MSRPGSRAAAMTGAVVARIMPVQLRPTIRAINSLVSAWDLRKISERCPKPQLNTKLSSEINLLARIMHDAAASYSAQAGLKLGPARAVKAISRICHLMTCLSETNTQFRNWQICNLSVLT